MKIIIIGLGASGSIAAINYKRNHPNDDVLVIEHLDKPLKKILATGNGKCNLGNSNINFDRYSNPSFVKDVFDDFKFEAYKDFLNSLNIHTKLNGELLYPISESAISVRDALVKEINRLHINVNLNEEFLDYMCDKQIKVITNKAQYECDKLFITGAGKSSPKLGSDGSTFDILKKHGYKVRELYPGLTPIYTKEKTKILDGIRVKANASLFKDNTLIHTESGEVLFKQKGLSGIVIFNLSSLIARQPQSAYKISLDLLDQYSSNELENLRKNQTNIEFLQGFIHPTLVQYFIDNKLDNDPIKNIKSLSFNFEDFYGFEFSQVSVGGLLPNNFLTNLESKLEKNVFVLGELIDVDGPCGGYNLTWAFYSAIKATK